MNEIRAHFCNLFIRIHASMRHKKGRLGLAGLDYGDCTSREKTGGIELNPERGYAKFVKIK